MSTGLDISRSVELRKVLYKYYDLQQLQVDSKLIMDAYYLRKPLTLIELYDEPIIRVREFVAHMREFFFVEINESNGPTYEPDKFYGGVYISRFKTLPTVAVQYDGLTDRCADLAGVLFGYPLQNIADYCQRIVPDKFK